MVFPKTFGDLERLLSRDDSSEDLDRLLTKDIFLKTMTFSYPKTMLIMPFNCQQSQITSSNETVYRFKLRAAVK